MNPPEPTIDLVSTVLDNLCAGERAWFWFCPELGVSQPILLLQPMSADPDMARLTAMTETLPVPSAVWQCTGMAVVGDDGRLRLCSALLSTAQMAPLARWAARHVDAHPGLARLRNTVFMDIAPSGQIQQIIEDPSLWQNLPEREARGTRGVAARILQEMAPSTDHWFWMTDAGPEGRPFLVLSPQAEDTDGQQLREQVRQTLRRNPRPGVVVQGIVRRVSSGALMFTTEQEPAQAVHILAAMAGEPEMAALQNARVVSMVDGRFQAMQAVPTHPPADRALAEPLAKVGSEAVWFWFTDQDQQGAPTLLLDTDRSALRDRARAVAGEGRTLRGELIALNKGFLVFQTRSEMKGFLSLLAGWVAQHQARTPALHQLIGARLIQVDADGNIVARVKDPGAWATITSSSQRAS